MIHLFNADSFRQMLKCDFAQFCLPSAKQALGRDLLMHLTIALGYT